MTQRIQRSKEWRYLRDLTETVLLYLESLDSLVATRTDVPHDVSSGLGKMATTLDMQNDQARYFGLGISYRKDNKQRECRRIRKKRSKN